MATAAVAAVAARPGRTTTAAGLLLVALMVFPSGAVAEPKPTIAQAKAKLVKLNERADEVVERYNQATEALKKAKKKYGLLNSRLLGQETRVGALRENLVSMAVDNYQLGGLAGWEVLVASDNPDAILSSLGSIDQMARENSASLSDFETATQELRGRRDGARAALAEADAARDKVRTEKRKADRLVIEQTALLRSLGAFKTGNPHSTGIAYTGSASGDARTALKFAYAQIGKPYQYGATGPNSFDCSGFAQAAWHAAGVDLPRTTWTQWSWGANRRVPLDELRPGDLLFSKGLGHMGVYAGGGKMVHAPHTGDVVKLVVIDDYWRGRLLGAIRP